MPNEHITIRYLTKKTKALESVKNNLQPIWPNLLITQTSGCADTLASARPDIIMIDASAAAKDVIWEIVSHAKTLPIIIVGGSKDIGESSNNGGGTNVQFLTPKEFKSSTLVHVVKHLIGHRKLMEQLSSAANQLRELTIRDDLTNLYNKRYIDHLIEIEFKKADRYKAPVSALILGVDGLKNINHTYGYDVGNKILCEFAILIQNAIREVDIAARLGSDEFVVLLPATDLASSLKVADRIKKDIHNTTFAAGKLTHNPTASIGVAECSLSLRTAEEWVDALRRALQEAKQSGRDQIRTFEDAEAAHHPSLSENTQIVMELQNRIRQLTEETKNGYFKGMLSLIENLPFYKKFIVPHSERVAFYAEKLATKIGMQPEEIAAIRRGGLLHDVGKVAIDKKILLKSNNLSHNEYGLLKQHPVIGIQIVGHTLFWKNELAMILHHHERFDGTGYPDKLNGTHIPLGARILAVAEAWDTMTTDQAYRPALPLDKAIDEIKRKAGVQFDPELSSTFTQMIEG